MKAAVVHGFGEPALIEERPVPAGGSVLADVDRNKGANAAHDYLSVSAQNSFAPWCSRAPI